MFFGKKLKELRLKHAGMGLHKFADAIGMCPSKYSEIEHGYTPYSTWKTWLDIVCDKLTLFSEDPDKIKDKHTLEELWKKPFVMQKVNEDICISPFVHTAEGVPLTKEKIIEFHEFLVNQAKEHNKKAEEYNKKNKNE